MADENALPASAADLAADWLLTAEYLWLRQYRDRVFVAPTGKTPAPAPDLSRPPAGPADEEPRQLPPLPEPEPEPNQELSRKTPDSEKISLPPDRRSGAAGTATPSPASRVSISAPLPLPGQRELAKALRPLARRVPSGRPELDVDATVDLSARQGGIFSPQMKQRSQRWLELNLVVDTCESVAFWDGLADQIEKLLNLPGAFRSIRRWNLRETADGWRVETPAGQPLGSGGIVQSRTAQCVMILTDTLSDHWFSPRAHELLAIFAGKHPTALLHLLPPRLWERSGIGSGYQAKISSPARGLRNHAWRSVDPGIGFPLPAGLPLPCLNLEASHFARFAGLITAAKGNSVQGMLLLPGGGAPEYPPAGAGAASVDADSLDPVELFFLTASREATRLACYLAAAPLVPPIMRMVQETFSDQPRHWHLTEVLCGGLVERSPHLREIDGMACYSWLPDVRRRLLALCPVSETRQVWKQIGLWLASNPSPSLRSLVALWHHASGTEQSPLSDEGMFFAEVNSEVWQTWGGEWAKAGRQLAGQLRREDVSEHPPEPEPQRASQALQGVEILWVDDYPENNQYQKAQLERMGANVTEALSTDAALKILRSRKFDAIISDLGRKEGDFAGLDLLAKLRPRRGSPPFAIYASQRAMEIRDRAMNEGAIMSTNDFREIIVALMAALRKPYLVGQQADRFRVSAILLGLGTEVPADILLDPSSPKWEEVWGDAAGEKVLFERAIDLVRNIFDTGCHQLFDFRDGEIKLVANSVYREEVASSHASPTGIVGRCAQSGESIYQADVGAYRYSVGYGDAKRGTARSRLAIPVRAPESGTAAAVINIESSDVDRFARNEIIWLEGLAQSLATALEGHSDDGLLVSMVKRWTDAFLALPRPLAEVFVLRCALRIQIAATDAAILSAARGYSCLAEQYIRGLVRPPVTSETKRESSEAIRRAISQRAKPDDMVVAVSALAFQFASGDRLTRSFYWLALVYSSIVEVFGNSASDTQNHVIGSELSILSGFAERSLPCSVELLGTLWPASMSRILWNLGEEPDRWILIAGLGSSSLDFELKLTCEEIGSHLAAAGYGLVCGGWPGVDEVVADAYVRRFEITGGDMERFIVQIIEPGLKPAYQLDNCRVADSDAEAVALCMECASAVILLSGAGGTWDIGVAAWNAGRMVLPIAALGGAAESIHRAMLEKWHHQPVHGLSREEFESLAAPHPVGLRNALDLLSRFDPGKQSDDREPPYVA